MIEIQLQILTGQTPIFFVKSGRVEFEIETDFRSSSEMWEQLEAVRMGFTAL